MIFRSERSSPERLAGTDGAAASGCWAGWGAASVEAGTEMGGWASESLMSGWAL
jgi:hypothetical protein